MEFEGYCVKDKKKVTVKNGTVVVSANGRRMAKGTCPNCAFPVEKWGFFSPNQVFRKDSETGRTQKILVFFYLRGRKIVTSS